MSEETSVNDPSEVLAKEAESLPKLTVAQFIADISKFPQDSELVASIYGIGLTIPIFQAVQVTSVEGKQLTILQISKEGAIRALQHGLNVEQEALKATENASKDN